MTERSDVTRRRILRLGGSIAVLSLAGCLGARTADETSQSTTTKGDHHEEASGAGQEEAGHHDEAGGHEETDHHEESEDHEDEHDHGEAIGEPVDHATVKMVTTEDGGYHFEPHIVRVKPGGTVAWTLESGSHTATAYHPVNDEPLRMPEDATPWDSGMMTEQGASFEHTFEMEGVYDYYCIPHEAMGMIGSVIVGDPDPHEQPALEPPQESFPSTAQETITKLNERVKDALGHANDSG